MSDGTIIEQCKAYGIDYERLSKAMASNDNWGRLVHAYEAVTVLSIVEAAMKRDHEKVTA